MSPAQKMAITKSSSVVPLIVLSFLELAFCSFISLVNLTKRELDMSRLMRTVYIISNENVISCK